MLVPLNIEHKIRDEGLDPYQSPNKLQKTVEFVGQLYFDPWNSNFKVGQLETRNSIMSDKCLPNNIQKEIRAR